MAGWVGKPELGVLYLLAGPIVFFGALTEFFKAVSEGLHRIRFNFTINLFEHGGKLTLAGLVLALYGTLESLAWAFLAALMAASIVGVMHVRIPSVANRDTIWRDILAYSLPIAVLSIGLAVSTEVDTIMLGLLADDDSVGIYAAAKQAVGKLHHIAVALSMGTMPLFARVSTSDREILKARYLSLLRRTAIFYLGVTALIVCTAWYLLPLVLGADYSASVRPLLLLLPYVNFVASSVLLTSLVMYRGGARKTAVNMSLMIVANILLNVWLIPRFGASGAAFATSASYLPYFLLNFRDAMRALEMAA
jgi:O-antigen/teichoic acid export membrane protein